VNEILQQVPILVRMGKPRQIIYLTDEAQLKRINLPVKNKARLMQDLLYYGSCFFYARSGRRIPVSRVFRNSKGEWVARRKSYRGYNYKTLLSPEEVGVYK